MKKSLALISILLIAHQTAATELPKLSYLNQKGFLKKFPLELASTADVILKYGAPRRKIDGLPDGREAWVYYKRDENDASFTFLIKDGKVYEIENKYQSILGPTSRYASKIQNK